MKRIITFGLGLAFANVVVAADPADPADQADPPPPPPPIVKVVRQPEKNQNGNNQAANSQNGNKRGGQGRGGNRGNKGPKGQGNAGNAGSGGDSPEVIVSPDPGGAPHRGGKGNRGKGNRNKNARAAGAFLRGVLDPPVAVDVEVRGRGPGKRRGKSSVNVSRRGPSEFAWSFGEARKRHHRGERRDRSWYRNKYNRFALFGGGYYYFDRGYWYPAYGYDPAYSTYQYDEPIYGYNNLDPTRVITNVQRELREQDYYEGLIDGLLGPQTRSALGLYQRDLGLDVTRSIDGPTLAALGLN